MFPAVQFAERLSQEGLIMTIRLEDNGIEKWVELSFALEDEAKHV